MFEKSRMKFSCLTQTIDDARQLDGRPFVHQHRLSCRSGDKAGKGVDHVFAPMHGIFASVARAGGHILVVVVGVQVVVVVAIGKSCNKTVLIKLDRIC